MIEVNTPTLMSLVEGMMRTAISAASSNAAPVSALGINSRAGSWPISGRIKCGATRPMKPMVPVTATEPPTPSATPMITISRNRPTSTPRLSLGEESITLAPQHDRARDDERQRQHDMAEAAILQRAEQPECDFEDHERIAGQIHHQRGRGTREARDRKARQ